MSEVTISEPEHVAIKVDANVQHAYPSHNIYPAIESVNQCQSQSASTPPPYECFTLESNENLKSSTGVGKKCSGRNLESKLENDVKCEICNFFYSVGAGIKNHRRAKHDIK
jgi:hypothetical protein